MYWMPPTNSFRPVSGFNRGSHASQGATNTIIVFESMEIGISYEVAH